MQSTARTISPGPWNDEPDLLQFTEQGFACSIARNSMGHLCGYVDLPPKHPDFGKHYDNIDVVVHGGLTFGRLVGGNWRIGFDCGHCGDLIPACQSGVGYNEIYRDGNFVVRQLESLAFQVYRIQNSPILKFLRLVKRVRQWLSKRQLDKRS